MAVCQKCGNEFPDGDKFCGKCGAPQEVPTANADVPPPSPDFPNAVLDANTLPKEFDATGGGESADDGGLSDAETPVPSPNDKNADFASLSDDVWKPWVRSNFRHYEPIFSEIEKANGELMKCIQFNPMAFFFGPLWFAYHKIYLGVVPFLLCPPLLFLSPVLSLWGNYMYYKKIKKQYENFHDSVIAQKMSWYEFAEVKGGQSGLLTFTVLADLFVVLLAAVNL